MTMTSINPEYSPATIAEVSDAMLQAVPSDEFRSAYLLGALAATRRRANPYVAPAPSHVEMTMPPDTDDLWSRSLEVEDLPYMASPVVELARDLRPDVVMAADRGGRLFGLAVYGAWQRRYPEAQFPSIDGKIHFGRISKSVDPTVVQQSVKHVLHRSGAMAELAQRRSEGDFSLLRVMLIDDWVYMGSTVDMVRRMVGNELGANEFALGTMRGTRYAGCRHVVGDERRDGKGQWSDNGLANGVDYDYDDPYPQNTHSPLARHLRGKLYQALDEQILPAASIEPAQKRHSILGFLGVTR